AGGACEASLERGAEPDDPRRRGGGAVVGERVLLAQALVVGEREVGEEVGADGVAGVQGRGDEGAVPARDRDEGFHRREGGLRRAPHERARGERGSMSAYSASAAQRKPRSLAARSRRVPMRRNVCAKSGS